ncbi:MAG: CBS domain-containing protein [Myxococcota bacterium]
MRLFVTHHNSDLDALASCVAAKRLYGSGVILKNRAVSQAVNRYLALHKDNLDLQRAADIDPSDVDEVVVVDVRRPGRLKEYGALLEAANRIVVFDHHPASDDDIAADEAYVEPVGACVTLLIERLQSEDIDVSSTEATLMLMGIYADTGSLSFDGTTPRDVDAAAWCMRQGGSLSVVNRYIRSRFTPEQRELLVKMLANTSERSFDAVEVAVSRGSAERYVRGASLVVNDIMRLGGHDAIFGVIEFEKDHRIQVVGRSRVSYVDVGEILGEMGGGGHAGAAACTLKDTTCESVIEQIVGILESAELRPTRVRDIMSSPIQFIDRDQSLREAKSLLCKWNYSGAPVLRGGELEGVISMRDIERAESNENLDLPVSSHMSHGAKVIAADEPLEDALEKLTQEDVGRLPVCEDGRSIGIVTRTDLIRHLYGDGLDPQEDVESRTN